MFMFERVAILGASRGLGAELHKVIQLDPSVDSIFVSSRKVVDAAPKTQAFVCDFTKKDQQINLLDALVTFRPTAILYIAGGGPFGRFEDKKWKDHEWALELGFLFPAKLLHFATSVLTLTGLTTILFVGSRIAESSPDPMAASYAASKHALKGLLSSVSAENPALQIKLYSPGYINTEMLPKNAHVRQSSDQIAKPSDVAQDIVAWLKSGDTSFHRQF
jgi:short-subunit dehydrogenase